MPAIDNVAVVIAVHNRLELTKRCIDAVRRAAGGRVVTFVVVDDGSTDGSGQWLSQQPDVVRLGGDGNLWFGGATNLAFQHVLGQGDRVSHVLIINNDTFVNPDLFDQFDTVAGPTVVIAGAYFIDDLGRATSAGFVWQSWRGFTDVINTAAWCERNMSGDHSFCRVDAVATTLLLVPLEILRRASLPSVYWHPHNRYDAVLSARLRATGARFVCSTQPVAHHLYGDIASRPSLRNLTVAKYLHEALMDHKSIWHVGGEILRAWETAPTLIGSFWGVGRVVVYAILFLVVITGRQIGGRRVPSGVPSKTQAGA